MGLQYPETFIRKHIELRGLQMQRDTTKAIEYYNLGKTCSNAKEAIECYENAVKEDPDHIYAWMRLAKLYELAGTGLNTKSMEIGYNLTKKFGISAVIASASSLVEEMNDDKKAFSNKFKLFYHASKLDLSSVLTCFPDEVLYAVAQKYAELNPALVSEDTLTPQARLGLVVAQMK